MAVLEDFFDLRIATLGPGEEPPPGTQWARIPAPSEAEVGRRLLEGWFHIPSFVTYTRPTPASIEEYIGEAFRAGSRGKPRRLLREVPKRYRLEVDVDSRRLGAFMELYRRTIAGRPRGRDRAGERGAGTGPGWTGLHLFEGETLVAGVLTRQLKGRLSVAYGAFDPGARRGLDLEHFLIMEALRLAAERGIPTVSLGMDSNRYGHHLALGLAPYKWRLGFAPSAWEPSGQELVRPLDFTPFADGLFFYKYASQGLVGTLFTRGEPDLRPYRHVAAPPIEARRTM